MEINNLIIKINLNNNKGLKIIILIRIFLRTTIVVYFLKLLFNKIISKL